MRLSGVLSCLAVTVLVLGACAYQPELEYWQRISTTPDAGHLEGPLAQARLERDLVRCGFNVDEIREIAQLQTQPAQGVNPVFEADIRQRHRSHATRAEGDPRKTDGQLVYDELYDLDTCMNARGWQRVRWVASR